MRSAYHGDGYRLDTDSDGVLTQRKRPNAHRNKPVTNVEIQVRIRGCMNVGRIRDRQGGAISYNLTMFRYILFVSSEGSTPRDSRSVSRQRLKTFATSDFLPSLPLQIMSF